MILNNTMKNLSFLFSLYTISLMPISAVCQNDSPVRAGKNIAVVHTEYGAVRGYIHNGIYTFKGIPYGKADRFLPPEKPASWPGVRSSMTYGPVCPSNSAPVLSDRSE